MSDKEKLKTMAAPNSERIAIATEELLEVSRQNLQANKDILKAKKEIHKAWINATARRFYVSLITVVLMGSAFYVDIILDGKPSTFLNTILRWLDFGSAIL